MRQLNQSSLITIYLSLIFFSYFYDPTKFQHPMLQKNFLLPALLSVGLGLSLFNCGGSDSEGWDEPTTGLITKVKEVNAGEFKIESEDPVPTVADSRIIVEPLQGKMDTFTLEEAKLVATTDSTSSSGRGVRSARMGFFGYLMIGRMIGGGPRSSAYTNANAYNNANNRAGNTMRSTSRRVGGSSRNSGFGSGKSTRSVGG